MRRRDEAIGRDAWLETIAQIDQLGIENLESLTNEQIREFFLSFIAHAIALAFANLRNVYASEAGFAEQ